MTQLGWPQILMLRRRSAEEERLRGSECCSLANYLAKIFASYLARGGLIDHPCPITVDSRKDIPVFISSALLQSREVYIAYEYDTTIGKLFLVLDGKPGSLASGFA